MTKNTVFAYLFALIGGIFGLHHLYLGRTQQAFLWLTTFGGFGLGILYDLFFAMQNYVLEANQDANVAQRYREKSQQLKSPAFELRRFCGKKQDKKQTMIKTMFSFQHNTSLDFSTVLLLFTLFPIRGQIRSFYR